MKRFLTIEEQFDLLKSRRLIIDENAKIILARENYYSLINGYKDIFLDRDMMRKKPDDVYKDGVSFMNIYSLFLFDRDLRNITFKYIVIVESWLKTAIVHIFCKRHSDTEAYRDVNNFTTWEDMLVPRSFRGDKRSNFEYNMSKLQCRFNDKLNNNRINKEYVQHYLRRHGSVPLWVLVNDLTFGNISNFFQLMKRGDQDRVCDFLNNNGFSNFRVNPRTLLRIFDVLVYFRNLCAHDERLYCAKKGTNGFEQMLNHLRYILDPVLFETYIEEIIDLINDYCPRIEWISEFEMNDLLGTSIYFNN